MADESNRKPHNNQSNQQKTAKKRKHSSQSDPIEVALANLDINDDDPDELNDDGLPLDNTETAGAVSSNSNWVNNTPAEEEVSSDTRAALMYLDQARDAVSAIKAQTLGISIDLKSIFPFMDLPGTEFPFAETQVASASQTQQGQETQQGEESATNSTITSAELTNETPINTESSQAEIASDNEAQEAQQGVQSDRMLTTTPVDELVNEISANTQPSGGAGASNNPAQQNEEVDFDSIATPVKVKTNTPINTEPSEAGGCDNLAQQGKQINKNLTAIPETVEIETTAITESSEAEASENLAQDNGSLNNEDNPDPIITPMKDETENPINDEN